MHSAALQLNMTMKSMYLQDAITTVNILLYYAIHTGEAMKYILPIINYNVKYILSSSSMQNNTRFPSEVRH